MMASAQQAPEWDVAQWFNTDAPLTLAALRGRVVMIEAFQMLCPGCVSHALPQAMRVRQMFPETELAVIGLHSAFEHHAAMTPLALQAFLHEYRITFPVGVDRPSHDEHVPCTMRAYAMRGTPTLLLIDRAGRLRAHRFGQIEDLALGAQLAALLAES